jgi:hypothetical protein
MMKAPHLVVIRPNYSDATAAAFSNWAPTVLVRAVLMDLCDLFVKFVACTSSSLRNQFFRLHSVSSLLCIRFLQSLHFKLL